MAKKPFPSPKPPASAAVDLTNWVRIVSYQYSDEPLSCAGSLHGYGGRFNAGIELDPNTLNPWPALYVAEDHATAYREKFQLAHDGRVDGLNAEELSLEAGVSFATVFLRGHMTRVFDMSSPEPLTALARVLRAIKMPEEVQRLMKRLRISQRDIFMISTARQLHGLVVARNWRVLPVQFGLPAQSHILAELVRAAGFEGILYPSSKGTGKCLAVFPETIGNGSHVELRDPPPPSVRHPRLDSETANQLTGWETLPPNYRNRLN